MHKVELLGAVAYLDPAASKKRQDLAKSASAIAVVGWDHLARYYALEMWQKRCATNELIEKVFEIQTRWKPSSFGVEANGMQSVFGEMVQREAASRGIYLPLRKHFQDTTISKEFRVETRLSPLIQDGRFFVLGTQHELRTGLMEARKGHVPDLVDALASAVEIVPIRPASYRLPDSLDVSRKFENYLKSTGRSRREVERILAERDRMIKDRKESRLGRSKKTECF